MQIPSFRVSKFSLMCCTAIPCDLLDNADELDLGDCCAICLENFNFPLDFNRPGFNKALAAKSSLILSNYAGDIVELPIVGTHPYSGRILVPHETAQQYSFYSGGQVNLHAIAVDGSVDGVPVEDFVANEISR